ncbi:molecular chaperone small heat shock protein [Rhizobium etli CNPAF512]|nr:molecular chaperone small heat shock protein [Rhizobium etli CNPAF512]
MSSKETDVGHLKREGAKIRKASPTSRLCLAAPGSCPHISGIRMLRLRSGMVACIKDLKRDEPHYPFRQSAASGLRCHGKDAGAHFQGERRISALQYRTHRRRQRRAGTSAHHPCRRRLQRGGARRHHRGEPACHPRPPGGAGRAGLSLSRHRRPPVPAHLRSCRRHAGARRRPEERPALRRSNSAGTCAHGQEN